MSLRTPPSDPPSPSTQETMDVPTEYLGPGAKAPSIPLLEMLPEADEQRWRGAMVGSIRVLDRLAVGGMGEIYAGFDEKLRRKVALKALRRDRLTESSRSRMLREARLLSRVQDPKICQIYGYLEHEGQDFLVLELIDGRTLGEAFKEGLDGATKLRIIEDVADVLVKAHGHGVVHRDLKPSNIMLASDGAVKVLDFGLASTLDTPFEEQGRDGSASAEPMPPRRSVKVSPRSSNWPTEALQTQAGIVLGTLAYMSPEQATGERATAASDVYALGLILEEMLTGRHPYEGVGSLEDVVERAQQIQNSPAGIDADLAQLIQRMRAVAPEARPAAAEVVERLRWVRDRPRRLLRWAAGLVIAAALVLAAVLHIHQLSQERNRALESERQALVSSREAQEVVAFMEEMFNVSNPGRAQGQTVTAREILETGTERILQDLGDQPTVQARLMATIGSVNYRLGMYVESRELLEESLAQRRELALSPSPEVADGALRLAQVLRMQNEFDRAEELLVEATEIHVATGGRTLAMADVLSEHSYLAQTLARYEDAEVLANRSLELRRELLPEGHDRVLFALRRLADLYSRQGRFTEALLHLERIRALEEGQGAAGRHRLGATLLEEGVVLTQMGRYDDAVERLEQSLEIRRQTLGPEHDQVARIENALAIVYRRQERFDEAEALWRHVQEVWERELSPNHPNLGYLFNNCGSLYLQQSRFDEAEAMFLRAQEVFSQHFGDGHANVSMVRINLGQLYWDTGRLEEAKRLVELALETDRTLHGAEHPYVGWDLHMLANIHRDQGELDVAETLYRESFRILEAGLGSDHPDLPPARERFLEMLRDQGRSDEVKAMEEAWSQKEAP